MHPLPQPAPPPQRTNASTSVLPSWGELLAPLLAEIDQHTRRAAREEYELLLAEKATEATEAERNDQVLTVQQAADLLEVRPQTVYEWVKAGKLQAYRVGRAVRLKRGQVLAALQAQAGPDGRRKYARRKGTKQ